MEANFIRTLFKATKEIKRGNNALKDKLSHNGRCIIIMVYEGL